MELMASFVALTVVLELAAHLGIRLFLGEQRYQELPVWINEAVGTSILIGGPTVFLLLKSEISGIQFAAMVWIAALLTGIVLGISHLVSGLLQAKNAVAEERDINEALLRGTTLRAGQ